jgi:hypothetical protein
MTKQEEFRIQAEGPNEAVEQLYHELRKLRGEGERNGVDVSVQRVETEQVDPEFEPGSEL